MNVFGKKGVKDNVIEQCVLGNKRICLAISEPCAGSDVSNIETYATKSDCGKY